MSGLLCRRAGAGDADALADLHARCFAAPWNAESFSRLLARQGARGLLAWRPDDVAAAGFALFEHAAEEAEILTLGVRPECRGQGVATGLLARAFSELAQAGARQMHLEVAADNDAALGLYRRAGFAESGRRPGYYRRGATAVDALIMTRRLAPPLRD